MRFNEWLNTKKFEFVYHETDSKPSSFNHGIDFYRSGSDRWYGKGLYAWTAPPSNSTFARILKFRVSPDAKILDLHSPNDVKMYHKITNECARDNPHNYLDEVHRYMVHYGIDGVYAQADFIVFYNSAKVSCVGEFNPVLHQ